MQLSGRPSDRLSRPAAARRCATGLLLWARRPGDNDRLLHVGGPAVSCSRAAAANAGSATLSADVGS